MCGGGGVVNIYSQTCLIFSQPQLFFRVLKNNLNLQHTVSRLRFFSVDEVEYIETPPKPSAEIKAGLFWSYRILCE
jgi:hypothetical protein